MKVKKPLNQPKKYPLFCGIRSDINPQKPHKTKASRLEFCGVGSISWFPAVIFRIFLLFPTTFVVGRIFYIIPQNPQKQHTYIHTYFVRKVMNLRQRQQSYNMTNRKGSILQKPTCPGPFSVFQEEEKMKNATTVICPICKWTLRGLDIDIKLYECTNRSCQMVYQFSNDMLIKRLTVIGGTT